jgi:hypothetical protein
MFFKNYGKGTIQVVQKKEEGSLTIVYANTKNPKEKKNIKLDIETKRKMYFVFRMDKHSS